MLSVGVGGYMQQWFGYGSVIRHGQVGRIRRWHRRQQSDSEIFFKGKLESDSGLSFSVQGRARGQWRRRYRRVAHDAVAAFGQITLGAFEDPASTLTHHGGLDVGISLNCGDTHKWIGGLVGCSLDLRDHTATAMAT